MNANLPEYEIHAIRYGRHAGRLTYENFMPPLPEVFAVHDAPMPMDFFVWVLRCGERVIAVDTGYDAERGTARNRELVLPVEDGLKALGIPPDAVEDVVITHMHWDHAGNHDLFSSARYHLQASEMSFCTGPAMCHAAIRRPYDADDVAVMVRRLYAGQVRFHDGAAEIAPGITVHRVGGHSRGLQIVRVHTRRGWVVLASDAAHYYANMEQEQPFPIVDRTSDMLEGFATVRALAASGSHYIPGHDPLVLARYPRSLRDAMPDIVRLDVAPIAD